MNPIRIKPSTAPAIKIKPSTERTLDPMEVAKALGAKPTAARTGGALGPVTLFAVRQELFRRLQSSGGRPALPDADGVTKVPTSAGQRKQLEELAAAMSEEGFSPSSGQVANVLLTWALNQLGPDSAGTIVKEQLKREMLPERRSTSSNPTNFRKATVTRHLLLMLSSEEPPPPRQEVATRAQEAATRGDTYLITPCGPFTRGLQVGESEVAFFGNKALGYELLGRGIFLGWIDLNSTEGQQVLRSSPVYSPPGTPVGSATPSGAAGFVRLRDVVVDPQGADIAALNGIIDSDGASNGQPLTVPNVLARGKGCLMTYFFKKSSSD